MQATLPVPRISDPPGVDPYVNIHVIHDDLWSGSHAVHVLSILEDRLGPDLRLHSQLWPCECLDDEDRYNDALVDAIKADIVIIAASGAFQPRRKFTQWLKTCVQGKHGRDSSIVLLLDGHPVDTIELSGMQFTPETTTEGGLDFNSSQPGRLEDFGERADSVTAEEKGEDIAPRTSLLSNSTALRRDSQRILYVEDDPLQRRLYGILLVRSGYAVTTAASAFEAWDELNSAAFDLLITDNEMPQFTGLDLVVKARGAGIGLPIIIASGSANLLRDSEYDRLRFAATLQKPFNGKELLEVIQKALATAKESPSASQDDIASLRLLQQSRSLKAHTHWGINE